MRARMRGAGRGFRTKADAQQVAFVAQDVPDLRAQRRIVPPVAPLAADASATPSRFERGEALPTDERAAPHAGEQQQQIGGQVCQFAVACFIEPPTPSDLFLVEGTLWVVGSHLVTYGFELVNLTTGAGLVSIQSTRVHKQRARDLDGMLRLCWVVLVDGCRDQRVPPQSKPSTRSTWVQSATVDFLTCTITSSTATRLPSGLMSSRKVGAIGSPSLSRSTTGRKQEEERILLPLPPPCIVRKTEAQRGRLGLQIEGEAIALAFVSPIVSSVGEHAHVEQRNGLHLLIACGEGAMDEEVVAGLLDHVLQGDESRLIVRKPLLQGFDGLFDLLPVFACGPLALCGPNEAFGEDGLDQRKHLLALSLCPHDPPGRFTFTAELTVTVRVRGTRHGNHLFPGGSTPLPHELVKPRPQAGEQCIDHGTAGVQQPQGIGLRLVWKPHVVAEGLKISACAHMLSCEEHLSLVAQV